MERTRNNKRKGFSLVELVVVMAIIGILLVVMAPNYKGFIDNAKAVGVKSDARTLNTMIDLVDTSYNIDESEKVSYISGLSGGGVELDNLKKFIDDLEGVSAGLKSVKISELKNVVETGKIPETTP